MKIRRRAASLLAALLLLTLPRVLASEQMGSLAIRMTYGGLTVSGGSITLYRVAELGDNWQYVPLPEFLGWDIDLNSPLSPADAERLAKHAEENSLPGQTRELGSNGAAAFSSLMPGLYLMVQREAGSGYLPVKPFFVSVPQQVDGEPCFHVDASPKCAPEPEGPEIPQTGQLRWPVPVMTGLGLLLLAAGLLLYRKESHA